MAQYLAPSQVENSSGVPLNGAKMYVYVPASTTPVSLYTEETLSTGTANPLVADASGMFPEAFLSQTKVKIIITTSAGVTVWTRDVVYTTGVATNVPASGVSFDGATSGLASDNVQDAIEEVVELQGLTQEWTTSSDGVIATGTSTNAGATSGPLIDLYRDSASPAASDIIGGDRHTGRNASAVKTIYTEEYSVILDTTNGSEDAKRVVRTMVAGTLADRLHVGAGAWLQGATGTDKGAGSVNASAVYDDGVKLGITTATPQVTTSGTAFDFTGLPAGVQEVHVLLSGVSTTGTDAILIQIGDSGGVSATGYLGASAQGGSATNYTTGFGLIRFNAADVNHGIITLRLLSASANTWAASGTGATSNGTNTQVTAGSKSLSGALDRVRVTRSGTDTFDAGSVTIAYA